VVAYRFFEKLVYDIAEVQMKQQLGRQLSSFFLKTTPPQNVPFSFFELLSQ
jgi:hypothetical protein